MSKDLIAGVIPESALALHVIALGKTRSGKSSKMRLIVEHCLERGMPVGIIDPKGDWWGIKLSKTGKSAGFPIIIFGGEHADVKINEHSGAQVADLVCDGNRPFLIDLGGWMPSKRTKFFVDFASTFFVKTRGKRVLMIDEVHNFAPQGKVLDPESGKALHWANRLASEGGGKGITLLSASQRPQKVHKDYVTSHETLIACKVIHKLDRDAVKDWIDGCGDPEQGKEVFRTLGNLPKPQAWAWCPEIKFGPKLVTFPMFKTYDSFKPQEAGEVEALKGWASVDLEEVNAKMAAVIAEEESKDPAKLKARVASLTAELKKLQDTTSKVTVTKPEDAAARRRNAAALAAVKKEMEAAMNVLVKINAVNLGATPEDTAAIERVVAAATKQATAMIEQQIEARNRSLEKLKKDTQTVIVRIEALLKQDVNVNVDVARTETITVSPAAARVAIAERREAPERIVGDGSMPVAARKMLAVVDVNPPVRRSWSQVATLAGLKARGGSFNTAKKALVESGLLTISGDLIQINNPTGPAAPDMEPGELVAMWGSRLSGSAPRILRVLFEMGGSASQEDVATHLNIAPRGGSWNTAWKELRNNDIVTVSGGYATLTELFKPR